MDTCSKRFTHMKQHIFISTHASVHENTHNHELEALLVVLTGRIKWEVTEILAEHQSLSSLPYLHGPSY